MPLVKVRFVMQGRLSTDGHNLKDYFKGDELILDKDLAERTILHPSLKWAVLVEENTLAPQEEKGVALQEQRGPLPDQKSIEELDEDLEDKQEEDPVDKPNQIETEKIENKSSKLKKRGK